MYFSNFPTTQFGTVDLLDITRKARLDKLVKENALAYMNYTVEEGERPEDVAFYYYDDPSYAWLVLLANDIIDPYTHWPKDMRTFEEYLKVQYEEKSGTTGDAVIEGTKNATIGSNIEYYQSRQDPEVQINRASYVNLYNDTNDAQLEFYPVRTYDYEFELNEKRREIVLVNKSLLPQIKDQLGTILHGS